MILGFSTQLNGKPTNFVSKIWESIKDKFSDDSKGMPVFIFPKEYFECNDKNLLSFYKLKPKKHTIREDKQDRWKKGNKIDFFINVRKKDMFRFAPVLTVVSTQSVTMSYAYDEIIEISINGKQLHDWNEILKFVHNDGFDNWPDFFNYFYPIIKATEDNWFEGKIIHWTDLKY